MLGFILLAIVVGAPLASSMLLIRTNTDLHTFVSVFDDLCINAKPDGIHYIDGDMCATTIYGNVQLMQDIFDQALNLSDHPNNVFDHIDQFFCVTDSYDKGEPQTDSNLMNMTLYHVHAARFGSMSDCTEFYNPHTRMYRWSVNNQGVIDANDWIELQNYFLMGEQRWRG